jgi:hypothetical protein
VFQGFSLANMRRMTLAKTSVDMLVAVGRLQAYMQSTVIEPLHTTYMPSQRVGTLTQARIGQIQGPRRSAGAKHASYT